MYSFIRLFFFILVSLNGFEVADCFPLTYGRQLGEGAENSEPKVQFCTTTQAEAVFVG